MPEKPSSYVCYVGIDPGATGGIAVIDGSGVDAFPMPQTEADIWENLRDPGRGMFAVIEWINPGYKGSSKSGMSKLYGNYMALRMALTAAGISFEDVKPRKWQSSLGIPSRKKNESNTQWKNRLKGKAQQLFPRVNVTLKTADALLIAEYCRRKCEGLL